VTDITKPTPQIQPVSPMQRRADALAELQQLHADYAALQRKSDEDRRLIERYQDRCELLLEELRTSRQNERVVTRKLIRLASAMANIGKLSTEAEEIMRSTREWQDETPEEAAAEQESAQAAVAALPATVSSAHRT